MRSTSDYVLHPNEDNTCFICGANRVCYGYIPARELRGDGPFYKISLCPSHAAACRQSMNALTDIVALLNWFAQDLKPSNRLPGQVVNPFCRLSLTDISNGYIVHPSVKSDLCFYCGQPSKNRRDRSPTLPQLMMGHNLRFARYVVPCCKSCYGILTYNGRFVVSLEDRAKLIASRKKLKT